jgi:hypothetical protein
MYPAHLTSRTVVKIVDDDLRQLAAIAARLGAKSL